MEWSDRGIVLGARILGESGVVLELMTRGHGRHLGLVHGGRSKRLRPVLQAGNGVHAVWRARLDEQLGHYVIEADRLRAARLIGSQAALLGIATLTEELRLLPERDPHAHLFDIASALADDLDASGLGPAFVRFELVLLAELGFGLDLASCAATGRDDDLVYVSPRTGRAVSREAGLPYRAKLLGLPGFLRDRDATAAPSTDDVAAGFRLTGHFLEAHVYAPRGQRLPDARERLVARLARPPALPARPADASARLAADARLEAGNLPPIDSALDEVP